MGNVANRAVLCEKLIEFAKEDHKVCIVTSDSRGSASLTPFADTYPDRIIEVGIAEQNLVGISAGLASVGMKPYVASPACFLTMRAIEQIKVDVAYSNTNVKLIGISAGISYGSLGMTHHSLQDIAVMNAIPNMTIISPSDRYETSKMMDALQNYNKPVYIRVGRHPVEDCYVDLLFDYSIGKANMMREGNDISIVAYGDMVCVAIKASDLLKKQGINARVINMHTIKPLDEEIIIKAAEETSGIIVVEEHSYFGGLGSIVSQVICKNAPCKVITLALPDETLVSGTAIELFEYYGLSEKSLIDQATKMLMGK